MPERSDDEIYFDSNGSLTERQRLGGQEVVVHYEDIPEKDITTVDGIPCTTALRTVIDIAPDLDRGQLRRVVQDCLDRQLFGVEEARARLLEPDMLNRPGAHLLRPLLAGQGQSGAPRAVTWVRRRLHHSSVKVAVWLSSSSMAGSRTWAGSSASVRMSFAPRVRTRVRSTPSCGR